MPVIKAPGLSLCSRSGVPPGLRKKSVTAIRPSPLRSRVSTMGIQCDERHRKIRRVRRNAGVTGPEDRVGTVAALDRRTAGTGDRRLQAADTSRKYKQRGRCIRFPPIDAILRICADADNSKACAITGNCTAHTRMGRQLRHPHQ